MLFNFFENIKKNIFTNNHLNDFYKKSIPTTLVNITGMFLALLVSIFLGKAIGPEGLGTINLANRILAILLVICMFGMRQVLIKEISIGYNTNDLKRIGDSLKTSYIYNVGFSLIISISLIIISPWLANSLFKIPELEWVLVLSFAIFPFQILSRIFSSGLNGYGKIWQSGLADQTLSILVVFIVFIIYYLFNIEISILSAVIAYLIGRLSTSLTLGVYWNRLFNSKLKKEEKLNELFSTSFSIFLVSITATIYKNIDIILIGWFCTAKEVGIYTVASRVAILSGFLLNVANSTVAPKFASLFHANKIKELSKLVQFVTFILFVLSFLILLLCTIFGNLILSIWGEEFIVGYFILVILSIGQFFNVSTGAVGTLLTMTGYEKKLLWVNTFFMFFNIGLNFILISFYGIIGAAFAHSFSVIGMNFTRVLLVYKYLSINIYKWNKLIN